MKVSVPFPTGFYVYLHRVNTTVVYVGKGSLARAFTFFDRNVEWRIATTGAESIEVETVFWSASEQEALEVERQKIIEFQPVGNLTFTDATRERRIKFARKGYDEAAEKKKAAGFRAMLGRSLRKRSGPR